MAGGVDTSARKPRRLRGTPALKFSNRFAAVVIGFGVGVGLLLNYLPIVHDIKERCNFDLTQVSPEEEQRRALFSFTKQNKTQEILKLLEEKERIDKDL